MPKQDAAIGIVVAISFVVVAIVSLMFYEIFLQRTRNEQYRQPIIDLGTMQEPSDSPSY